MLRLLKPRCPRACALQQGKPLQREACALATPFHPSQQSSLGGTPPKSLEGTPREPQAGGAHSLCSRASGRGGLAPSSRRAGSLLQAGPREFPLSSAAPPLGGGGVGSGAGWCTGPAEGSADPSDPGRPQHRLFLAGTLQVRSWQSLQGSVQAVILLSLEALHLVWSKFSSFDFLLFKDYICELDIRPPNATSSSGSC